MDEPSTNNDSCLFLTRYRLIRARCAFEVIAKHNSPNWERGERVKVEEVKEWDETTLLFKVKEGWYSHSHFYYILPTDLVVTGIRK